MRISEIIELLQTEYGSITWRSRTDPLSELIMTILSQNTSDRNSRRAFDSLFAKFGSWEAVAGGSVEDITEAIKLGGLAKVKAPRIKQILQQIRAQRGSLDLGFLKKMPVAEGVGAVDEKYILVPMQFPMLKPVIEDEKKAG